MSVDVQVTAPAGSHRLTHMEAVVEAIAIEMRRDPRVFLIGQDIGPFGGAMQGTKGAVRRVRARARPRSANLGIGDGWIGARRRALRMPADCRGELRRVPAGGDESAYQSGAEPALHDRRSRARSGCDPYARRRWSLWRASAGLRIVVRPYSRVEGRGPGDPTRCEGTDARR